MHLDEFEAHPGRTLNHIDASKHREGVSRVFSREQNRLRALTRVASQK